MATPNFLALTTITPGSVDLALSTTSATQIVTNAAASSQTYKVKTLFVTNNSTTTAYVPIVNKYSAAALGGTAYPIFQISIPALSTAQFVTSDSHLYLLENTSLGITAPTANVLTVECTYEVCS